MPTADQSAAVRLQRLDFRYSQGGFRLYVDALDVGRGERLAVVGASGSGKTTLLDLVAGIRIPAAGHIDVGGNDLAAMTETARREYRLRHIGLIFQTFELLEYLTVRDNLLLPFRLSGTLDLDMIVEERLTRLALDTAIFDRLDRHPGELSQGERQRAAICRALITAPDLLLVDEPTSNLDPNNKQKVLELLLEQAGRHGATLVMVTHDHDLLAPFDRVVDMRDFAGRAPS